MATRADDVGLDRWLETRGRRRQDHAQGPGHIVDYVPGASQMTGLVSPEDVVELTNCFESSAEEIFRYAMLVTNRDRALSDDVVQQVFEVAAGRWAKLRDLPHEQRIVRLKAIARNKAVDAYRRSQTARIKQCDIAQLYQVRDRSTHGTAMVRIAVVELWSVVRRLPERQFLIALMRFRDDMTYAAIATELGVSTGTVSAEIGRIRSVLISAVGQYLGPDELG
jgi:RNA polymerase sigma-70 factor, ECF subfamily